MIRPVRHPIFPLAPIPPISRHISYLHIREKAHPLRPQHQPGPATLPSRRRSPYPPRVHIIKRRICRIRALTRDPALYPSPRGVAVNSSSPNSHSSAYCLVAANTALPGSPCGPVEPVLRLLPPTNHYSKYNPSLSIRNVKILVPPNSTTFTYPYSPYS